MKLIKHLTISLTILILATCAYAGRPIVNAAANQTLAPMLKTVTPTIVNIAVRGELPMVDVPIIDNKKRHRNVTINPKFEDLGSGVIVDAEHGYILTNAHVIKDAQAITVTLGDGRSMIGKVIGYDAPSDIAVIQIAAKRLKATTFGDSDKLQVGDFVCAIGSPFGLQQTVTSGMVSAVERSGLGIEGYENFIQIDAPINPGNSGGALVNMQGELVGINTAIIAPAPGSVGIGLAIPSNMAKSVMDQIIKYGKVKRGILGVMVQDITPALAEAMHLQGTEGALISQVMGGTPAAAAGLHEKDVITKIMGKPVHSATQVRNTVSLMLVGSDLKLQVWRDGKLVDIKATVADPEELKKKAQDEPKQLLSGLELRNFSQLVDNQQVKGVETLYVDDSSIAYSCGLRDGDVILAAANQPVSEIDELQSIADKNPKQLLLEIKRGMGGHLFLVLEE